MKLAKRGLFYSPTFTSSKSASKWLCEEEMRYVKHKAIWDAGEKDMCITAVCNDKALVNRVTQKLAGSVQTRKSATRNKFMSLLGYTMLVKRTKSSVLSSAEKDEYNKQCTEAIKKLTELTEHRTERLSWWRTTEKKNICYSDYDCSVSGDIMEGDVIFRNGIGRQVLYEFLGHDQFRKDKLCEGTILLIARLDAYVNTFCKLIPVEVEKRTGNQKLYSECFSNLLPRCLEEILQTVRNLVDVNICRELTMSCGGAFEENDRFQNDLRDATVVVQFPSVSRYYVVVKDSWFSENITNEIGYVIDCVVGYFTCEDVLMNVKHLESKPLRIDGISIRHSSST